MDNQTLRKNKRDWIHRIEIHRDSVIDLIAVWGPLLAPLVPAGLTAAAIIVTFPELLHINLWGAWAIAIVTVIALEVLGIVSVETWLDMKRYNVTNDDQAPEGQARAVVIIYAAVVLGLVFLLKIWHGAALFSLIPLTMLGLITSWTIVLRKQHNQRVWESEQSAIDETEELRTELEKMRNRAEQFRTSAETVQKDAEQLRTELENVRTESDKLRTELESMRNSSTTVGIDSVLDRLDDGSKVVLREVINAVDTSRITCPADAAKVVDANKTKVYEMFRLANAVGAIYPNGDGAYHVK